MDILYSLGIATEDSARKYLAAKRWGKWAICPHCGNDKSYFIDKGVRYKCASKVCYKKYSVTVKTIMEGSNITLLKWLKSIELYVTSEFDLKPWDLEKKVCVAPLSANYILERIEFAKPYILIDNRTYEEVFDDLLNSMLQLVEKFDRPRRDYIMDFIDDIGKIDQYEKCIRYAKYWLRRAHWMFIEVATPQDIIAETFIYLSESGIKEYNADRMSFYIRKITQRLWMDWVKAHPATAAYYKNYNKEWQRDQIRRCTKYYLRIKIKKIYPEKMASEIYSDRELIKIRRERIMQFRNNNKKLDEFISHFS